FERSVGCKSQGDCARPRRRRFVRHFQSRRETVDKKIFCLVLAGVYARRGDSVLAGGTAAADNPRGGIFVCRLENLYARLDDIDPGSVFFLFFWTSVSFSYACDHHQYPGAHRRYCDGVHLFGRDDGSAADCRRSARYRFYHFAGDDVRNTAGRCGIARMKSEKRTKKIFSVLSRRQPDLTIVMENIHDPHNVSAMLRSADTVGIHEVQLVYTREKFPRVGKKSSSSANKWVERRKFDSIQSCYERLHSEGFTIYATRLDES